MLVMRVFLCSLRETFPIFLTHKIFHTLIILNAGILNKTFFFFFQNQKEEAVQISSFAEIALFFSSEDLALLSLWHSRLYGTT